MNQRTLQLTMIGASLMTITQVASAATWCVNPSGTSGCKKTISAAVSAASPGDTIYVGRGDYKEGVIITKSLSLKGAGDRTTTIDAHGQPNGIFINGTATSPIPGVGNVAISGFTITGANYEGILAASATGVTITHNHVTKNNLSLTSTACPGIPSFETDEAMDCGEGIHLMSTDHSIVAGNLSDYNSGGILVTDETGPNYANLITENIVKWNGEACGITLASHPAATLAHPTGPLSFGVFQNTVLKNESSYNGLNNGGGAGVGMYAAGPGNYKLRQRRHRQPAHRQWTSRCGHARPCSPRRARPSRSATTPSSVTISVTMEQIRKTPQLRNHRDQYLRRPAPYRHGCYGERDGRRKTIGISFNTSATATGAPPQLHAHLNQFDQKTVGISTLGTATVDGTLNWWGCAQGPGKDSCATTTAGVASPRG